MSDDLKTKVQRQFGASADGYATSDVHAQGESLGVLLELVEPRQEWRVLDIATGAGHTALAFAPRVTHVTASDLTAQMLAKTAELAAARGVKNVETRLADAESLPFDDATLDLVTCRLAFHHFPEPQRALSECDRVLKPGGVLGFTDNITVADPQAAAYYNAYETLRDPSHHCVYSLAGLQQMMDAAGFAIRATRELSKEFEFHNWADRQHVSDPDKDELLRMMREIPEELQPLFAPRWADGTLYFSLWEVVIVAVKSP